VAQSRSGPSTDDKTTPWWGSACPTNPHAANGLHTTTPPPCRVGWWCVCLVFR